LKQQGHEPSTTARRRLELRAPRRAAAPCWIDAFLNAAMIFGGMGPVDTIKPPGGKLFAGLYARYSGVLFLAVGGLVFSPLLHRLLHRFHVDAGLGKK